MILLTKDLRARLLANGRQRDIDHVPVVKFFNPVGVGTWLITEMEADGDTLFGLADLGFGSPELGSCSLAELTSVRLPFGLGIERDILFEGIFPLSVYPKQHDRPAASCRATDCSRSRRSLCRKASDVSRPRLMRGVQPRHLDEHNGVEAQECLGVSAQTCRAMPPSSDEDRAALRLSHAPASRYGPASPYSARAPADDPTRWRR